MMTGEIARTIHDYGDNIDWEDIKEQVKEENFDQDAQNFLCQTMYEFTDYGYQFINRVYDGKAPELIKERYDEDSSWVRLCDYGECCLPKMQRIWQDNIDEAYESENAFEKMTEKQSIMRTGKVMELLSSGKSWNRIREYIKRQNLSDNQAEQLCLNILYYTSRGPDFIDHVYRGNLQRGAQEWYSEEKRRETVKSRRTVNKQLILTRKGKVNKNMVV